VGCGLIVLNIDGSDLFAREVGAIVTAFGADREHPRRANALVSGFFYSSFFRSK